MKSKIYKLKTLKELIVENGDYEGQKILLYSDVRQMGFRYLKDLKKNKKKWRDFSSRDAVEMFIRYFFNLRKDLK